MVTPDSTDDEDLKSVVTNAVAAVGGVQDRSGVAGVIDPIFDPHILFIH